MKLTDRSAGIAAAAMLFIMFLLALFSMKGDALTMDEKSHLPAGYSYLTQKDMRINPEHPPLVKDIAAIPLLFISGINFPYDAKAWTEDVNGQWDFGHALLFDSGNPADTMIFWGRIPMILLLIAAGCFIFKWSKELFGPTAAVISTFLFAFSPTYLAHGRLVTTDVGASLGILVGSYYFIKALQEPTRKNIIVAGLALGIAELLKFSVILLFPFFILLAGIWWIIKAADFKSILKTGVSVYAIAFLVIGPVYLFHVWNYPPERQARDSQEILATYGSRAMANTVVWAADKPILRAYAQYFLGVLMVTQRVAGGNTTYFLGEISKESWKSYFPTVYLIKETVTFHLLTLIALLSGLWSLRALVRPASVSKFKSFARDYFAPLAMVIFIGVYWITSIAGNLNIGVRHLLPLFPFTMILAGAGTAKFINGSTAKGAFVAALCLWQAVSIAAVYPSFLAYFNEFAGGPKNGYLYVADSNLDWGQDLKRLNSWTGQNGIDKIYIDYFGGADAEYYLGDKYESWWGSRDKNELPKGSYLAVSATFLQGGRGILVGDSSGVEHGYYSWLNDYHPVAQIGYSIFVYHIQ